MPAMVSWSATSQHRFKPWERRSSSLAGSAATLIKQLSVGTKLSTLTPRDRKAKKPYRDVIFFNFFYPFYSEIMHTTHTSMHKRSEACLLLYLPVMWGNLLSGTLSQVGTKKKKMGETSRNRLEKRSVDSTFILRCYDLLNVLERF